MKGWPINCRVLVVDDEEGVRDNFAVALRDREKRRDETLAAAASARFGESQPPPPPRPSRRLSGPTFEVDFAADGPTALDLVERAVAEAKPYALIFCDIRMPIWDGIETVERIRKVDRRTKVILVTAYSDHDVSGIVERAGADVGYFVKPFTADELRQMATKAILEWNEAYELEQLTRTITALRGEVGDMERLLAYLLRQLCQWLQTDCAALVQLDGNAPQFRFAVGDADQRARLMRLVSDAHFPVDEVTIDRDRGAVYLPIREFGFALALSGTSQLGPEQRYLLRIFLEHAAIGIRNCEMRERLLQAERLAAAGQVVSYLLDDLRGPLGRIRRALQFLEPESEAQQLIAPREAAGMIDRSVRQAYRLLDEALEFAQGGMCVEPEPADLGILLAGDLEAWHHELPRQGVEFSARLPSPCPCMADASAVPRIFRSLVANAAQASEGHTGARVELFTVPDEQRLVAVVRDNAPTLPESYRSRLFEPFDVGRRPGLGFGLAIAKRIAREHKGDLLYDQTLTKDEKAGFGNAFRVELPLP